MYDWSSVATSYPLWVAQYASNNTTGYQSNPWTDSYSFGAWAKPPVFQYSATGRVGYKGDLDLDLFYGSRVLGLRRQQWTSCIRSAWETFVLG